MRVGAGLLAAALWSVALFGQATPPPATGASLHRQAAIGYLPLEVPRLVADANRVLGDAVAFDARRGYLEAVLTALDVPVASQLLLFSRTGAEQALTSPQNPRAFYFNDHLIVSHVPGASQIEIAYQDDRGGARFFTVAQSRAAPPRLTAQEDCLRCHVTVHTLEVPGFIARSMYTGADGRTYPGLGSYTVDHRRDYAQRWGGWLVTGAPDSLRHLGNTIVTNPAEAPAASVSDVPTLEGRLPTERYLTPYSDVTALAVFDHQMHAMNLLTRLAWQARLASAVGGSPLTDAPTADLLRETADYLLFVDEAPLDGPITGGSGFAETFSARGPRDGHGRSLRDFDRQTRLFRYPVSYMVYAPIVKTLPPEVRAALFARMREILDGRETAERYQRPAAAQQAAALEILAATHPAWR